MADMLNLLDDLVRAAQRAGADAADAVLVESASLSVGWRMGTLERMERSESADIGLRVLVGRQQAMVSSSDQSPDSLHELVERAVAMARVVPEDPYAGLAEPELLARTIPDLQTSDSYEPSAQELLRMVQEAEDSARACDGITNSDGAGAGWGRSQVAMVGSNGFAHAYTATSSSVSVTVLAGQVETGMERDYDYSSAVYFHDLASPHAIGQEAARRAVRRLGARKVASCAVPVVFDPRVSRGLLGSLASAINGAGVARGTTFLKDKMGCAILPKGVRVMDNPHLLRGMRSRPCDGEGVETRPMAVVEDGVLQSWLLDCRSARQLGLRSTGHASRGTSSPPSPSSSNFYLEAGSHSVADMLAAIPQGLYVTDLFGQGVNGVTGDYSRGAVGFWIENGQITYPVHEITIAGNLKDMFQTLCPANDLVLRYGIDCPTLRIDGMIVAGK